MPQRTTRREIATIPYRANQLVREQLQVSGKVRKLFLKLSGTLNVTDDTGATQVGRNPGTLIPYLALFADREILLKSGRWNDWRDRMWFHFKLPADTAVPVVVTIAEHAFVATIQIPFITPQGARPVDTVLNMDAFQRLDLEIQWADEDALVDGGVKAFSVDPVVSVIADVSRLDPDPVALYKENAFDSTLLGDAANTDLQLELVVGPRINYHHICLIAENDAGAGAGRVLAATAMNEILVQQSARGELSYPYGPVDGAQLQNDYVTWFTRVNAVQTGTYPISFQGNYDGRNTYNLATGNPVLDDLRLRIDHAGFDNEGTIRVLNGTVEPLF